MPDFLPIRIPWTGCAALFATALAVSVWLCAPAADPGLRLTSYAGVAADARIAPADPGTGGTFQRLRRTTEAVRAEYGFVNFNDDALRVTLSLPQPELESYQAGYGYTEAELDALLAWQRQALQEAFQAAMKNRSSQADLDRAGAEIRAEYFRRHRELLLARGFRFLGANLLAPDIPAIVRRNVQPLRPLALAINQAVADRGYDTEALFGAGLSLVQTSLRYKALPPEEAGRVTGGMRPPLLALATGEGDCDSKSALLAATLLNWDRVRLVGVGVPNHYLLGILRNPARGDAFVEYGGLQYVLAEPAGPGWLPPGHVARTTLELLGAGDGVTIEPLTVQ